MRYVCRFSCGAASAVMCKLILAEAPASGSAMHLCACAHYVEVKTSETSELEELRKMAGLK